MIQLVLALAAAASPAPPPSPFPLETLLARPVTPGSVALLISHAGKDPRADAAVISAIAHADAPVRAIAARVAAVGAIVAAGPALRAALEAEPNAATAAEELRALLALTPPGKDLDLMPAVKRHALIEAFGEAIAVTRGPEAILLLPRLREEGYPEDSQTDFVAAATRWGRDGLSVAAALALRTADPVLWGATLALAREPHASLPAGQILVSLRSPSPGIRAETYWHLAVTQAEKQELPADLEAAVAVTPEAAALETADVNAGFAYVALRRASRGRKYGGDWGTRAGEGKPTIPVDVGGRPARIGRLLTDAEARALSRAMTHGSSDAMFKDEPDAVGRTAVTLMTVERIAAGLPAGAARDVLAVTGCAPVKGLSAAAVVDHHPDGRPRHLGIVRVPGPAPCAQAAIPFLALARSSERSAAYPTAPRTMRIVAMDPEAAACAEEPEHPALRPAGSGPGKITPPRKVKHANPVFPDGARIAGQSGTVLLEAVITASGCMRSVTVIGGVSPELDAAAADAVSQWRYSPALIDGTPVPTYMKVTINFRIP